MRRGVFIFLLLVTVLVTSCGQSQDTSENVVCNAPYIRFGPSCCLDANANGICDTDERGSDNQPSAPDVSESSLPVEDIEPFDLPRENIIGDKSAKVIITEYADASNTFTNKFYEQIIEKIKEDYIDTGKVAFVYYHAPSKYPNGLTVARAIECASDQGGWKPYYTLVMRNPDLLDNGSLKWYARSLNLNTDRFNSCIDSDKHTDRVKGDYEQAKAVGYEDVHIYFINEDKYNLPMILKDFKKKLDAKLA